MALQRRRDMPNHKGLTAIPRRCELRSAVPQSQCPRTVCVAATAERKRESNRRGRAKREEDAKAAPSPMHRCAQCHVTLHISSFGVWTKGSAREGDVMRMCKPARRRIGNSSRVDSIEASHSRDDVLEDRKTPVHANRAQQYRVHKTVGLYDNAIAKGLLGATWPWTQCQRTRCLGYLGPWHYGEISSRIRSQGYPNMVRYCLECYH